MAYTYETTEKGQVIKRSDGAAIPVDPANKDYQDYLLTLPTEEESELDS